MVRYSLLFGMVIILSLAGCSTEKQLLKVKLAQLHRFEANAADATSLAENGQFKPSNYDLYMKIDRKLVDAVLEPVNGMSTTLEASKRKVRFSVQSIQANFKPGTPEITIAATARDEQSGVEAIVDLDANLAISEDPERPGSLVGRVTATRIVPRIRGGLFDLTERRFVRDLLALEAMKITEKLPSFTLPTTSSFAVGTTGGVVDTGNIPTGNGSWMRGDVTYPESRISGQVVVKHVLVLSNGIHLFADVEGLQ